MFYMAQLILGVEALHSLGIIHRDLKPENILIDANGHLVIADLGLARVFKSEHRCCDAEKVAYKQHLGITQFNEPGDVHEVTHTCCGTLEYAAPEVLMKRVYDKRADLWTLGLILYNMVFGRVSLQLMFW